MLPITVSQSLTPLFRFSPVIKRINPAIHNTQPVIVNPFCKVFSPSCIIDCYVYYTMINRHSKLSQVFPYFLSNILMIFKLKERISL